MCVKAFNFMSLLESLEFIQLFVYFSLPVNSPLSIDVDGSEFGTYTMRFI